MASVVEHGLAHLHAAAQGKAQQRSVVALVAQHYVGVILQVLANARELMAQGDALGLEFGCRTNAGEHQQVRAAKGAC
ncbi:hypothetical protein D3C78_1785370 [compost metagenome]